MPLLYDCMRIFTQNVTFNKKIAAPMTGDTIKIKASKKRIPASFITGLIFLAVTMLLLRVGTDDEPEDITDSIINSIILIIPLFYTSIGLVDFLRIQFDPNSALYITQAGIEDNLSTMSCGEIRWDEIAGIEVARVLNLDVLVVELVNPATVINRQAFVKRLLLKRYAKKGKSPVIIPGNKIDYDIFELKRVLTEKLTEFKTIN